MKKSYLCTDLIAGCGKRDSVFANREIKNKASKESSPKPLTDAERRAAIKQ